LKEETRIKVTRHGKSLIDFFHLPKETDPVKLCKRLRKIEKVMRQACLAYCNGLMDIQTLENVEIKANEQLRKILGDASSQVVINTDPRGYSLKIDNPPHTIYRDFGGYGIVAPDLS